MSFIILFSFKRFYEIYDLDKEFDSELNKNSILNSIKSFRPQKSRIFFIDSLDMDSKVDLKMINKRGIIRLKFNKNDKK